MVAQNAVRTYGMNQTFRIVEGIWLHRKSRQIFLLGKYLFYFIRTCFEQTSYISTMAMRKSTAVGPRYFVLFIQQVAIQSGQDFLDRQYYGQKAVYFFVC